MKNRQGTRPVGSVGPQRDRILPLSLIVLAFTLSSTQATLTFDFDSGITGGIPASATKPWLRAEFTTLPGPNEVSLTLSALNLTGNEDVQFLYFNLVPTISQAQLNTLTVVNPTVTSGSFDATKVKVEKTAVDNVTLASHKFDFSLGLPSGNPNARFTQGDVLTMILKMNSPGDFLTEDSFNFLDTTGTYHAGAHVRNTTVGGSSGFVGVVPEPSTWIAGALLLLPFGLGVVRAWRAKR